MISSTTFFLFHIKQMWWTKEVRILDIKLICKCLKIDTSQKLGEKCPLGKDPQFKGLKPGAQ